MQEDTSAPVADSKAEVVTLSIDPSHPMAGLVDSIATPPKTGDLIEGTIIALARGRV